MSVGANTLGAGSDIVLEVLMTRLSLIRAGLVAVATLTGAPAFSAELTVRVSGLETNDGKIGCALHRSSDTFPMGVSPIEPVWVAPSDKSAVCRFADVTDGTYAIAVSHDLNGNQKTDTNFFGIPTEAWGVSRNVRPTLRAPTFSEASFEVAGSSVELTVEVAQ